MLWAISAAIALGGTSVKNTFGVVLRLPMPVCGLKNPASVLIAFSLHMSLRALTAYCEHAGIVARNGALSPTTLSRLFRRLASEAAA